MLPEHHRLGQHRHPQRRDDHRLGQHPVQAEEHPQPQGVDRDQKPLEPKREFVVRHLQDPGRDQRDQEVEDRSYRRGHPLRGCPARLV